MTADQSYKFERILMMFTYIMVGAIIFSMLSFFGVIDVRTMKGSYCITPEYVECSNMKIKFNQIQFDLTYNGPEIYKLKIIPSEIGGCNSFEKDVVESQEPLTVTMACSMTAPKGKKYTDEFQISFLGGRDNQGANELMLIKARVE